MGSRKNFNAWLTRKLGWYGAFMATAVCLVILTCGFAAFTLQTGPRELFVPGLLAIAMFAAAGPLFWVANKEPGRIHIRPALAGMAVRLPPAEPGASLCEPLKAACAGSLTRPRLSRATLWVAGHRHMFS